jgi:serine/threonine-protein kinase
VRFRDGAALAAALRNPAGVADGAGPATVPVAAALGVPVAPPGPETAVLPATSVQRVVDPADDERSGGGLAWLLAILVGALLVLAAWLLWRAASDQPDPTPSPSETVTVTPSPTESTVSFPASVCDGSVADVVDSINRRDLVADRVQVDNTGDGVEGQVIDCSPTGPLEAGSTVTVRYWGPAPTPSETPTPTPTPTDSTSASPTASTSPLLPEATP